MSVQPKILVTDGDSLTAGVDDLTPWPSLVSLSPGSWTIHNVAISGETLAQRLAAAPTAVDPFFDPAIESLVVIWAGTNDFVVNGSTPAEVWDLMVEYCNARRAVGWKVLIVNMISREGNNPVGGETLDTDKNELNALIAAGWHSVADGLVDMGATALGADGAYANTNLFLVDGIHPNQNSINTIEVPLFQTDIENVSWSPMSGFQFLQATENGSGSGGSSIATTFADNVTPGSVLVALAWCQGPTTVTGLSDGHNTWTQVGTVLSIASFNVYCFVAPNTFSSSLEVTSNLSANSAFLGIAAGEWSGPFQNTIPTLFASSQSVSSGTAYSVGPIMAGMNALLVNAGFADTFGVNITPGTGWNVRQQGVEAAMLMDQIAASAGNYTANGTLNSALDWGGFVLSFENTPPPPSVYSVPDCRNYGNFPNDSVDVNGTLQYTVPTVDSRRAGAPVDSRVSKPVACGTYPQNSRAAQ